MNKALIECDICKNKIKEEERIELTLDGTDDIYNLTVCEKCYDKFRNDYISPEEVNELLK